MSRQLTVSSLDTASSPSAWQAIRSLISHLRASGLQVPIILDTESVPALKADPGADEWTARACMSAVQEWTTQHPAGNGPWTLQDTGSGLYCPVQFVQGWAKPDLLAIQQALVSHTATHPAQRRFYRQLLDVRPAYGPFEQYVRPFRWEHTTGMQSLEAILEPVHDQMNGAIPPDSNHWYRDQHTYPDARTFTHNRQEELT